MALHLKNLRQTLKALADDTRLRIVHLLSHREMTVKEIGFVLEANQPFVSKHLTRLRLLHIVNDRRERNFIHYSLNTQLAQGDIVLLLLPSFRHVGIFQEDVQRLKKIKKHNPPSLLKRGSGNGHGGKQ